jgi:hypothetical protein
MIYIIIVALISAPLCMIATARWGIGGAIASYVAMPLMLVGNALVRTALAEGGLVSLDQTVSVVWLGLLFYFSTLWYWPLPAIIAGLAIYWFRKRPRVVKAAC